jgi:hypothetical protein
MGGSRTAPTGVTEAPEVAGSIAAMAFGDSHHCDWLGVCCGEMGGSRTAPTAVTEATNVVVSIPSISFDDRCQDYARIGGGSEGMGGSGTALTGVTGATNVGV